jgi:single-stranded DNA-binding protein
VAADEHQRGGDHGQPHTRSRAALASERHSVCTLRIANTRAARTTSTASGSDKPNYFDVTVWGAQGENCARFLTKGARSRSTAASSGASGGQDGTEAPAVEIIADSVQFLGGRDDFSGRRRQRLHAAFRRPGRHSGLPARRRAPAAGGSSAPRTTTSRSVRVVMSRLGREPSPSRCLAARAAARTEPVTMNGSRARPAVRAPASGRTFTRGLQHVAKQRSRPSRRRDKTRAGRPAAASPASSAATRSTSRLQGRRHPAQVHLRPRQDPLAAHHRRLPPASEPDRHGGQARARAGAAPVRRRPRARDERDRDRGRSATDRER